MEKTRCERVNISLSAELLAEIDREAARCGDSRSNFLRRAVIQYLDAQRAMRQLPELMQTAAMVVEESKAARLSNQIHLADLLEQSQSAPRSSKKAPKKV